MTKAKSIPIWIKYIGTVLIILLVVYIIYRRYWARIPVSMSSMSPEGFQITQATTMRKWSSTVVLNGNATLTSYGININGADYVIYTIPTTATVTSFAISTYKNLQGSTLLEGILSHKNMKYILDLGIAMIPTDSAQIKYIPQIIENGYRTLTMFNDQKTNMRYVALKPFYMTNRNNIDYYYMSYIPYYITSTQNTTLEKLFTDKMVADDTARKVGVISSSPSSFVTGTQLPITGKVFSGDTISVPIQPLYFSSKFLSRDINSSDYKKLIDDADTGGGDHSINYNTTSLNIFPSLTFNSIYDKYFANSAYANWDFNTEMTKYLSVSFRTEAMAGITITPAQLCSYLHIFDGNTKKYLSITESSKNSAKTYGPVSLTTDIKLATKFNVDLGGNGKCIRYSIPAGPNNLSRTYVLGVLYINPGQDYSSYNMLCFCEANSTYTPIQLTSEDLTILKDNAMMHNDKLPWYIFENRGDNTASFIYGSGAYNTYLTVSGTSLITRVGSSRSPTPGPVIIYNSPAQLDIKYKYASAPISNLYKIPNFNEYVYLDTSSINPVTNQVYSRLVLYMPPTFPQVTHTLANGVLSIQSKGANLQLTSADFYHYNITQNSSNITLNNYTINVLTCPQTINIGVSLPKYVPPMESVLSSYTQSNGIWQIKSSAYPAINNAQVYRYESKSNPAIHMFRLLDTGDYIGYIFNPADTGVGLLPSNIDINAQNTELAVPGKFIYYKNQVRFLYNSITKLYTINEVPKTERILFNVNMTVEPYIPPTTTMPDVVVPEKPKPVESPAEMTTTTQYIAPQIETTTTQFIPLPVETTTTQFIPPPVETSTTMPATTEYIPSEEEPPIATEYYKPGNVGVPRA